MLKKGGKEKENDYKEGWEKGKSGYRGYEGIWGSLNRKTFGRHGHRAIRLRGAKKEKANRRVGAAQD